MRSEIHDTRSQQDRAVLPLLETGVATMKMLELFSGTKTVSTVFEQMGYEVYTIDINPDLEPSLAADLLTVDSPYILSEFGYPNVIWASPDCTKFSWASGSRNEFRANNTEPLSEDAEYAIELVQHTLTLIDELQPEYWFLENPNHGALASMRWMKKYPKCTVAYCQYGKPYRKLTDIWGQFPPSWSPRTRCNCIRHEVQNIKTFKDAKARSEVPKQLALDIAAACVKDAGLQIATLRDWL